MPKNMKYGAAMKKGAGARKMPMPKIAKNVGKSKGKGKTGSYG